MNKYIIKNCPCLYEYGKGDCCNDLKYDQHTLCKDCTDCLIKQVINKCTVALEVFDKHKDKNLYAQGRCATTENILQLFEIEECE